MKLRYIFSLAVCLLSIASISAQNNFVFTPAQHRVDQVAASNYEHYDINMTTQNPEAITFAWERISNTFPAAWSYSMCDQGGCYVGCPASGTMSAISLSQAQGGMTGFFKINLTVGSNIGQGKLMLYVYDVNDYNRGDTLSFDVTWAGATGTDEEASVEQIKAYPNPAIDQVRLTNTSNEVVNVQLYNVIGQSMEQFPLNPNGNELIDLSHLQKGVYFLRYQGKSATVRSEKLIIN